MMRCICAFGMGVMVGCCFKSCKEKMCQMMSSKHCKSDHCKKIRRLKLKSLYKLSPKASVLLKG